MRLDVLGPVALTGDGGRVDVTPRKAREALVVLALDHPRPTPLIDLIDALWDDPPPAARKTVQAHLSRLRTALVAAGSTGGGIVGGPAGYRLADDVDLDVTELAGEVAAGRRALAEGAWTVAVDRFAAARRLLRGPLEVPPTTTGAAHRVWLEETEARAAEDNVEALLRGGRLGEAGTELERLTTRFPLRERLWLLRMAALALDGRQSEALRIYATARRLLLEEIGVEPGEELAAAERAVLDGRVPDLGKHAHRRPERRRASAPVPVGSLSPAPAVRYVEVDGVQVAWCQITSTTDPVGDLVILTAGAMPVDSVFAEPRLAAAVSHLAAHCRVTWLDRRGIGLSDRCTVDQLPTVADWVRDVRAVQVASGLRRPVLLVSEDTTAVALQLAVDEPEAVGGIALTNGYGRFTRAADYPYGLDPLLASDSAADVTATEPSVGGFDLLRVIAPSVADDAAFRRWWDDAGRRGASPQVAHALRTRLHDADLRPLLQQVRVPVLHLVNPAALIHDVGHDRWLEANVADIETVTLPGADELWWLDTSGAVLEHLLAFTQRVTAS